MNNTTNLSAFNIGDIVLCHRGRSLKGVLRVAMISGKKRKNGYIPTTSVGYTKNGYFKKYPSIKSSGTMEREKDITLFEHSQLHQLK